MKKCPKIGVALSQDCAECNDRPCRSNVRFNLIVIGVDQSYKNCGISIAADGKLLKVSNLSFKACENHSEARKLLRAKLTRIISLNRPKCHEMILVFERIRQFSNGFISMPYITGMGALNAVMIDTAYEFGVKCYSVNTKSWKAKVVGTSKPECNDFGVPPEKWPTVKWCIAQGFEKEILNPVFGRKTKGTFIADDGNRYEYDNDAADGAAIAMSPFCLDSERLKEEF